MIKVVADTNIYISALNFRGIPDEVLALARKNKIKLFISPFILSEIEGVLTCKFEWSSKQAKQAITRIKEFTHLVNPKGKPQHAIKDHETDNRILECAQEAQAHFIVSGDSHLKGLKVFQGIRIVSPAHFTEIISESRD